MCSLKTKGQSVRTLVLVTGVQTIWVEYEKKKKNTLGET